MFGFVRVIVMLAVLMVVCGFMYLLFGFFRNRIPERIIYSVRQYQWSRYMKRKSASISNQEQVGVIKERGILLKIDKLLDEAGWRRIYSYFSSEVYFILGFIFSVFPAILGYMLSGTLYVSFLIIVLVWFLWGMLLYICAAVRYKKIQGQLMFFINLLENYSRTSDDLVDIIAKTENYLEEPLKNTIAQFQWEARHTGEIETAIGHLKTRLSHRKMQEIIQNLDMCRRHEANYAEVISDMRVSIQEYLKSKEERNSINQTAKGSILVMMLVGLFIMKLVNGFVEGGIYNLLTSNILGMTILVYQILLIVFGIWQFIKVDRD